MITLQSFSGLPQVILARSTRHLNPDCPENTQIISLKLLTAHNRKLSNDLLSSQLHCGPGYIAQGWSSGNPQCGFGCAIKLLLFAVRVKFCLALCVHLCIWQTVLPRARGFAFHVSVYVTVWGRVDHCLEQDNGSEDLSRSHSSLCMWLQQAWLHSVQHLGGCEWGVLYRASCCYYLCCLFTGHISQSWGMEKKINQWIHFVYV